MTARLVTVGLRIPPTGPASSARGCCSSGGRLPARGRAESSMPRPSASNVGQRSRSGSRQISCPPALRGMEKPTAGRAIPSRANGDRLRTSCGQSADNGPLPTSTFVEVATPAGIKPVHGNPRSDSPRTNGVGLGDAKPPAGQTERTAPRAVLPDGVPGQCGAGTKAKRSGVGSRPGGTRLEMFHAGATFVAMKGQRPPGAC